MVLGCKPSGWNLQNTMQPQAGARTHDGGHSPEVGSSAPFQLSPLGKHPVLADISRNSARLGAQVMLRDLW